MNAKVKLNIIAGPDGRIIAAQGPSPVKVTSEEPAPEAHIIPGPGQHAHTVEVPAEIMKLTAPDLQHYLSEVKITERGEVELPKIKIVQMKH